jgi:RNA polymerase sigma-70 factor (ECF subfamily)
LEDIEYADIPDTKIEQDILAKELVHDAMLKIPFEYRSALILKEIEGLSYEEIAKALKISLGTVESRIFRARKILKEVLIKKGVFKDEM